MADSDWALKSIDELKAPTNGAIAIGPFGSRMKSDCYVETGVEVIRGTNISDTRVLIGDMVCITPELADQLGNAIVRADDLVFPHRGSIGLVGIVPRNKNERYALSSSLMKLTCDQKQVEPLFLFYFFRSAEGKHELLKNASTVGTPGIGQPLSSLRSITLRLPPLPEQRAIAHILGTLDDKIELNRRMNATLEAMARALFKSWFVDFDPVRAKMDGRWPVGMDQQTAALFPDILDEDGKPAGWSEKRIDELMELAYGKALKATERIAGPIPVYGSGGLTGFHNKCLVEVPSVIVGRKGTVGSLYWEDRPFFPIDTVFYVKPKAPLTFCYYLLQTLGLDEMNTDAAVPGLNRNNVYRLTIASSPTDDIRRAFDGIVKPIRQKMSANEIESNTLAILRDTLLPKLVSGEVTVNLLGALQTI